MVIGERLCEQNCTKTNENAFNFSVILITYCYCGIYLDSGFRHQKLSIIKRVYQFQSPLLHWQHVGHFPLELQTSILYHPFGSCLKLHILA
jgi:hypothetical protein